MNTKEKRQKRIRRHKRVRAVVRGTTERPRLSVFRSNTHIYAQLIDDSKGITLLSASDAKEKAGKKTIRQPADKKIDAAFKAGESLGQKAIEKGISSVVFDRGGFKYLGRVKALADGARSGGLKF